jgi:NSS family neurotransmitter:Na+ symporter
VALMPMLFVLIVGLALYAATLDGAGAGYAYYLGADFSKLLSLDVLKDATGQAFFSLSLGMGAMLTFASYLGRDVNLPRAAAIIAGADIAIAFVAGLVVFPMIFALNLSADVSASSVGALFITLPKAFAEMGSVGRGVGILFFAALIVGALTSAISLLEVVVSSAIDVLGWSRRPAGILLGIAVTVLGAPSAWSTNVLGAIDQVANNILLLGGGFALSIFVGWVMAGPVDEVSEGAAGVAWFGIWRNLLRYAVPAFLLFVLVYDAIPSTFRTIADLF